MRRGRGRGRGRVRVKRVYQTISEKIKDNREFVILILIHMLTKLHAKLHEVTSRHRRAKLGPCGKVEVQGTRYIPWFLFI